MANRPDAHPDSSPSASGDSADQATIDERGKKRTGVEDAPGDFAGTAGTGGENEVQDQSIER